MDISLIDRTIEELEDSDTTFPNCADLASLYIVRNFYKPKSYSSVESELNDIAPSYKKYCDIKRKYQLNEITYDHVINSMRNVCREISEFIMTLYSNTESREERELLTNLLVSLSEKVR